MAIDPKKEKIISLQAAAARIPLTATTWKKHMANVYRFTNAGIGELRLETTTDHGSTRKTSVEAVERFLRSYGNVKASTIRR